MKKISTRAMVEGAVFASVTAVLGILVYYMPLLSLIGMFWAVPIIIMGFRNGFKVSFVSAIVAAILVSIFTEPYSGIYLFLVFGISGIVMGNLMNRKVKPSLNIIISGLILGVCSVAGILMSFWIMGQPPAQAVEYFVNIMNESIEGAGNIYGKVGMPKEQIESIINTFKQSIESLKLIIPTVFLLNGIIFSFINYKIVKMVLERMKYTIEDVKPFSQWRVPDNFSLGLIIVLFLTIAASYLKIPNIGTAVLNIVFLLKWIFTLLGLSVAAFMLDKYGVSKMVKYIVLIILFFSLANVLTLVGLIDTIFNIRKIDKKDGGGI